MAYHDSEEPLRLHIRKLLLQYSITHLTTDYVQFTQDAVSDLLSQCLSKVPTSDPGSLRLPTDPFDKLAEMYNLATLAPYEGEFKVNPEALQYMRDALKRAPGEPKSERVSFDDDSNDTSPLYCPLSPVLTANSMHKTPRLGLGHFLESMPRGISSLQSIKPVEVEPIEEPRVSVEKALGLGWHLGSEEHLAIRSFLKSTSDLSRPRAAYQNPYLDFHNRRDSPPISCPEGPFVPIFPRSRRPGSGVGKYDPPGLKSTSDLSALVMPRIKVEETNTDLYKENMVIVDGWQTYNTSSPLRPSTPMSSQGDPQFDEFLRYSSPDTDPPLIQTLMNSKMDVVSFPRTNRMGGAIEKPEPIGGGGSLASFLLPLLPNPPVAIPMPKAGIVPENLRASPAPSMSMVGQPPSMAGVNDTILAQDDPDELDAAIVSFYEALGQTDPKAIILDEKLDQKSQILMDVPSLPPPNVHPPNALVLPTKLTEFIAPLKSVKKEQGSTPFPPHRFLGKVKGTQSLALALSWVAFTVDKQLPNHAQISAVSSLFDNADQYTSELLKAKTEELFIKAAISGPDSDYAEIDHWKDQEDPAALGGSSLDLSRCEIILTREERRRLARAETRASDAADLDDGDECDEELAEESGYGTSTLTDEGFRHAKRARLGTQDADRTFNDSGIALLDDDSPAGIADLRCSPVVGDDLSEFDKKVQSPALETDGRGDGLQCDHTDSNQDLHDTSHEGGRSPLINLQSGRFSPVFGSQLHEENEAERDYDHNYFEPLSLDSYQSQPVNPSPFPDPYMPVGESHSAEDILDPRSEGTNTQEDLDSRFAFVPKHSARFELPTAEDYSLGTSIELTNHSLGLAAFAQLRAKTLTRLDPPHKSAPVIAPVQTPSPPAPRSAPEEIYDSKTLRLPINKEFPTTLHRYMASLEVLQKQSLVRALRFEACAVDLVERETLGGPGLILDPHTAIIFAPLLVLPSQCEVLTSKIAQLSWLCSQLLVIYEAYPASCSYKSAARSEPTVYPYTPPILKAIKKVRRDLVIAEACGTKRPTADVRFAFASDVNETAAFVRHFGDLAEGRDETQGAIWGDRVWLDEDMSEDEERLASLDGMNRLSASIILCQVSLQEFLDLAPDTRLEEFGAFLGVDTLMELNADIERRHQAMILSD